MRDSFPVRSRDLRFRPPAVRIDKETEWVLRRAFAPPAAPMPEAVASGEAVRQARRLGMSARVAARLGRELLAAELGPAADPLLRDRNAAAARALLHEELLAEVAEVAAGLRIPLVLLKGGALTATGAAAVGSRYAGDLDLLVPARGAAALQRALRGRGFQEAGRAYEQHLPPLRRAGKGVLELHLTLLGVRLGGGRRSADWDELAHQGLLVALPGPAGECAVPARAVLAAHALVHGLAQHGLAPRAYPGLQVFADLIDLGFVGERGDELAAQVAPWIARSLSAAELSAAAALCRRLAADEPGWLRTPDGSRARTLLDHALASGLDERYAHALRLRALARPLSDRSPLAARLRTIAASLQTGLLVRLGRYAAAWWAVRRTGVR